MESQKVSQHDFNIFAVQTNTPKFQRSMLHILLAEPTMQVQ